MTRELTTVTKSNYNNDKNYENDIVVPNDRRDSVCACALRRVRVSGRGEHQLFA